MFAACPHCQFLVARDPRTHALPAACTRCGKPLDLEEVASTAASPSLATFLHPVLSPTEDTATEATQAEATPAEASEDPADDTAAHAIEYDGTAPEPATDAHEATVSIEPGLVIATADATAAVDTANASSSEDADTSRTAETETETEAVPHDATPSAVPQTAAAITAKPKTRHPAGPRFLHGTRTTPVRALRGHWVAVVALSLLLCVQVMLADRARLATQSGWRPIVVALCGVLRCDVPTWREPAAFTMLSRDVRPIVERPGTLQAQATFRNEARWAQAWPVILLTLKDADGRTLGARALAPADYLPQGEASPSIGPGQSAQMAVRVKEPSANVVAFSFDFR